MISCYHFVVKYRLPLNFNKLPKLVRMREYKIPITGQWAKFGSERLSTGQDIWITFLTYSVYLSGKNVAHAFDYIQFLLRSFYCFYPFSVFFYKRSQ